MKGKQGGEGISWPTFHASMEQVEAIIERGNRRAQEAADQNKVLPGYKRCQKCQRNLRASEANFHMNTSSDDGFSSVCKMCDVRYVKMRLATKSSFNRGRG